MISSAAYVVGAVAGQIRRASAHMNFVKSLDDRVRFFQALHNINRRLGGEPGSLDWISVPSREGAPRADVHGDTAQPVEGDVTWAATNPVQQSPGAVPAASERGWINRVGVGLFAHAGTSCSIYITSHTASQEPLG